MIKNSKNIVSYMMGLAFTLLFSCSTNVKKAEIPNTANPQDEILEDLRKGRGYLEMAYQASENRAEKVPGLFEARQSALKSGVAKDSDLKSDLQSLDSDVSASASEFSKVSTEKISAWQDRYLK